jgi:hypothetical protein
MVVDTQAGIDLMRNWSWLVGEECCALIATGFGDVFYWSPTRGINYLDVQGAEVEFADADGRWLLGGALDVPQVVEHILRKPRFEELVRLKRPLKYHEVFILEPWPMLGGEDKPENYDIGQCDVYIDLVGQTYRGIRVDPLLRVRGCRVEGQEKPRFKGAQLFSEA